MTCPRCGATAELRFYGPCPECVIALRAAQGTAPTGAASEATRYEPKMNVTVNAVALKDD